MRNQKLHCLLVGKSTNFIQLVKALTALDTRVHLRNVGRTKKQIEAVLKSANGPRVVFVSEEAHPPLALLADLIRQYRSNAIVVIVTQKTASIPIKRLYNGVEFTKLNIKDNNDLTFLHLRNIIRATKNNQQFRQCKKLLAIAEQRNIWLLDSSSEAIAYISTDAHYYANTAYLALFGIDSSQILHELKPKDLIVNDEARIFCAFLQYQTKHHMLSHTLLLSMKSLKHNTFRASMHAIPSVYKGKKCWQVWVHQTNRTAIKNDKITSLRKEGLKSPQKLAEEKNPFDDLHKELSDKKKKADIDLIQKGIIKRKDANLFALKLVSLKSHANKQDAYHSHYILTLHVPVGQRKGVDSLLFRSLDRNETKKRQLFWDKVKVARLIQLLSRKNRLYDNYIIALSDASIANPDFIQWMLKSLKYIGIRSRNLTVMIPSELETKEVKTTLEFVRRLKKQGCKIALNDFTVKSNILKIIRYIKPDFIRLSLDWVKGIESDESQKNALSNLLRQLEVKNIQVIAPCTFSAEMRKMFVFSGVSFCQERTTKTA
jgi:PAS domain-containing protein